MLGYSFRESDIYIFYSMASILFFKRQIIHQGNIYYLNPDLHYQNVMRWPNFSSHVPWCYGISCGICTRKKNWLNLSKAPELIMLVSRLKKGWIQRVKDVVMTHCLSPSLFPCLHDLPALVPQSLHLLRYIFSIVAPTMCQVMLIKTAIPGLTVNFKEISAHLAAF